MSDISENTSVQLWPWQKRAFENGRTPLPENPGERPWLDLSPDTEISATPLTASENVVTPHPRWWTESEMRRLIDLRSFGVSWPDISVQFPGRTLQGCKQTYRKRRFAIERQMKKEALAAASVGPSLVRDDDEKSNQ